MQLAKLHGAEVTCVDSTKKLDMLKSLGTDYVIDYMKEDFTQLDKSYDLILDVVGTRSIFNYKRVLKPNGTYVMVGGSLSLIFQLLCLGPLLSKTENKTFKVLVHKPNKNDQDDLIKLFMDSKILPVIDRRFNLNQVKEAILYLGEGHAKGKIIVSVVDDSQT
ncbi:NAD(P)-dependent alcohol dehydrogenase [Bacillales bacterium AN1005]